MSSGRSGPLVGAASPSGLSGDEVHVWRIRLDGPDAARAIPAFEALLSPDERERAARFRQEADRAAYTLTRGVLRSVVSAQCGVPPAEIRFLYNRFGKPALDPRSGPAGLEFNVSHTRGRAVLAVALGRRVGVDVEHAREFPGADRIVAGHFSANEVAAYQALPPDGRRRGFFAAWTRKEAFIKALGEGLSCPLDSFAVTLDPGAPVRLLQVRGDRNEAARWSLFDLTDAPDYPSALAAEGTDVRVVDRLWPLSGGD